MIREQADEALITVSDFSVKPAGNLRFLGDRLTLHPMALVGTGYNSNVYGTQDNAADDVYFRYVAGAQARSDFAQTQSLTVGGEFERKKYLDEGAADLNAGRGNLVYDHQGPLWRHLAKLYYLRVDDPVIAVGEQIEHDDYAARFEANRAGLNAHLDFGLNFDRTDYREDSREFDRDQRDGTTYEGNVVFGLEAAEGAERHVRLAPIRVVYDEADPYQDSYGFFAGAGGIQRSAGRSSLSGELGVAYRHYEDDFAGDGAYGDQNVILPVGSARAAWSWEDGSDIHLGAHSRLEDSVRSNAAWNYGVNAGVAYRLLINALISGDVGWLELRDSGTANGADVEVRDYEYLNLGVIYSLREGLSARLAGKFVESQSQTSNDYERLLLTFDIAAVF